MVKVYIEGMGIVKAVLIKRYADGDVRVRFNGVEYICKEAV